MSNVNQALVCLLDSLPRVVLGAVDSRLALHCVVLTFDPGPSSHLAASSATADPVRVAGCCDAVQGG